MANRDLSKKKNKKNPDCHFWHEKGRDMSTHMVGKEIKGHKIGQQWPFLLVLT